MVNKLIVLLISFIALVKQIKAVDMCAVLGNDTTCSTAPECSKYVINSAETACINCYQKDGVNCVSDASAVNNPSQDVCKKNNFILNATNTACIINCAALVTDPNPQIKKCNTDSTCERFVLSYLQDKCVDCITPLADGSKNSDPACDLYQLSYDRKKYVNCELIVDRECNSDKVCSDYILHPDPNKKYCIDCNELNKTTEQTNVNGNCAYCTASNNQKCVNINSWRCTDYHFTDTQCFDCGAVTGTTCKYSGKGCSDFAYNPDPLVNKCVDCTIASKVDCIYKAVPGCAGYRFNGLDLCINCALLNNNVCKYNDKKIYPYCSAFGVKSDQSTCIDCSLASNKICTNLNNSSHCSSFVYSEVYEKCVDCSASSNGMCINESVPDCYHYKYYATDDKCVDCSVVLSSDCKNQSTTYTNCAGYNYSSDSSKCINCSNVENGKCKNEKDKSCYDFKFDGQNTCVNCKLSENKGKRGCSEYRYDSTTSQSYNCSAASGGVCTNSSISACSDFKYDGSSKCFDCSISINGTCINQSIAGCVDYRYDSLTNVDPKKCVDCTLISDSACKNSSIPGCLSYKYDEGTSTCFDCYGDTIVWDDKKCYACFKQSNIITAQTDGSGCKSPYDGQTTTVTDNHSSILSFALLCSTLLLLSI